MFPFLFSQIKRSEKETSYMLSKVLDGDQRAAGLLAKQVHSNLVTLDSAFELDISKVKSDCQICLDNIGIWIDPIGM